jgi:flavodoxin
MNKSKKGLVVYSSKTGNTRQVAEGILKALRENGYNVNIAAVEENPAPADWNFVGFWLDRGDMDAKAAAYVDSLKGRTVGLFGTLGAPRDSAHARTCSQKAEDRAAANNTCLGSFLVQGKIDPALIESFKKLPQDNPHYPTGKSAALYDEAARHPDDRDIADAAAACLAMLEKTD